MMNEFTKVFSGVIQDSGYVIALSACSKACQEPDDQRVLIIPVKDVYLTC